MTLEELKKAVSEQIIVTNSYNYCTHEERLLGDNRIRLLEWFQRMLNEVEK